MPDYPVYTEPSAYIVSCLPPTHRARRHYTITVEIRNPAEGLWAVCANGGMFDSDGQWDWDTPPLHCGYDAWIQRHRFPLDEALTLAQRLAPTLTANQYDVAHALAHPDWR